jgi:hypothetical protein
MEVRNRAGVEWTNIGERLGSFMESGALIEAEFAALTWQPTPPA